MADRVVVKMTKHFGVNTPGEICSFSAETAKHILKHDGAEKLAELEPGEIYDTVTKRVIAAKKA